MNKILSFMLPMLLFLASIQFARADEADLITDQIPIEVETAGSLNTIIGSNKKPLITNLKITGTININDIQFLREMAGCYTSRYSSSRSNGHLQYLDLSEASLDASGGRIYTYDGTGDYEYASISYDENNIGISYAFSYLSELKSVILPRVSNLVGEGCFYGSSNLQSVTLSSLYYTSIGKYAFMGCTSLTRVNNAQYIQVFGQASFKNCRSLSQFSMPKAQTVSLQIGDNAFEGCTGLTSLSFPQNTKSIGQEAFAGCSNLSSVKFDDNCSITSIGSGAFQNCTSLTNIAFPYNVKSISASTFEGCTALQNIDTWQVTDIGSSAFKGCTNLKALYLNNVNRIDNSAFEGCSNLNDVTFHTDVSSFTLKSSAFKGCTRLTSITLPSATTSVNDETFSGCTSLKSITLPPTLTNIGYSAFKNCNSLHFIKLPYALTSIGLEAFSGCTALDSIYAYMEKPITLSNGTFSGVDKNQCVLYVPTTKKRTYWLANVWGDFSLIKEFDALIKEQLTFKVTTAGTLSNQVNNWLMTHATDVKVTGNVNVNDIATLRQMAGCYQNNGALTDGHMRFLNMSEATLLCNVGAINVYTSNGDSKMAMLSSGNTYSYLFAYLPNIEEIRLPQGMTATGSSFFYGDTNLKKAWLPSGITSIGTSTFNDCRSLTSVNIPSTVTEFKNFAFFACESLPTITLPSSLTTIGRSAFYACRSLQSITIPSGVTKIEDDTFFCCALSFIELPEGITSIGGTAFYACSNLKSITLPASLTEIGSLAFQYCS